MGLGRPEEAYDAYREAVTLLRRTGDFQTEAAVLNKLGLAAARMDNPHKVYYDYRKAVLRALETGSGATDKVLSSALVIVEALAKMLDNYDDAMSSRPPALRPVPDPPASRRPHPGDAQKGA